MLQLSPTPSLSLNDGWSKITGLLKHLEDGLFGLGPDNPAAFTPADYAEAHSLAYEMCTVQSLCRDLYRRLGIHFADVAQRAVARETRPRRAPPACSDDSAPAAPSASPPSPGSAPGSRTARATPRAPQPRAAWVLRAPLHSTCASACFSARGHYCTHPTHPTHSWPHQCNTSVTPV